MLLPPPHPACRTTNARKRLHSSQKLRLRFFDFPPAKPSPIRASGIGRRTAYKGLERWPSFGSIKLADLDGAVIVSVDVTGFAPGVTDVGDREHVANAGDEFTGDGVTEQDS